MMLPGKEKRSRGNFQEGIWIHESTHLLIIAAVIKVEEKILKGEGSPSNGQKIPKWKQIAELLPPALRETRTDTIASCRRTAYKCARMFDTLLKTYRGHLIRLAEIRKMSNVTKSRRKILSKQPRLLTEPVMKMLQKREDLLHDGYASECIAGAEVGLVKTRRSERIRTLHQNQLKKESPPITSTANDISSQGPSLGSVTGKVAAGADHGQGAESFSESDIDGSSRSSGLRHMHRPSQTESESSTDHGKIPHFDNYEKRVKRSRIDDGRRYDRQALERQTEVFESGSESESYLAARESNLAASASELPRSDSEFPRKESKPAAGTRALSLRDESLRVPDSKVSAGRRPFRHVSLSDHQSASDSGTQTGSRYHDKHLQGATTDRLLRGLDHEFSLLSSWIRSQIVPIGNTVVNEITSSAKLRKRSMRSCNNKRFKPLSDIDSEPAGCTTLVFDELIHESSSKKIDHKIHASFQKLRILFAKELQKTSVELAHEVVKDAFLQIVRKRPSR